MKIRYLFLLPLLAVVPALLTSPADAAKGAAVVAFEGVAVVGSDGNGVVSASFPTPGGAARWYLTILGGTAGAALPDTLQVTLNSTVVASQTGDLALPYAGTVTLSPGVGSVNDIIFTATGVAGSMLHFAIAGRALSSIPLASLVFVGARADTDPAGMKSYVTLCASGGATICWLLFYDIHGLPMGLSPAVSLLPNETGTIDLGALATAAGMPWVEGSVRIICPNLRGTLLGRGMLVADSGAKIRDIPLERVSFP